MQLTLNQLIQGLISCQMLHPPFNVGWENSRQLTLNYGLYERYIDHVTEFATNFPSLEIRVPERSRKHSLFATATVFW
jgi:hypothetical protein